MAYSFAIEPLTFVAFDNEDEQINKCKEWGLLSGKASKVKTFTYKGNGLALPCRIVGYVDSIMAVIEFDNRQKHCIHPSYLKEMQASNFGPKLSAAGEGIPAESDAGEDGQPADAGAVEFDLTGTAGAEAFDEDEAAFQGAADADMAFEGSTEAADDSVPWYEDEADAGAAATQGLSGLVRNEPAAEAPAAKPAKEKAKKPAKLQLPEEKVKMTATVQEFTTVPNNFSDNDDEVVIYEAVSILDPQTEIGTAWSSHSSTLKKLDLQIGDVLTFECKIVAKKLTKHPVPYKINNPAKIQKQ